MLTPRTTVSTRPWIWAISFALAGLVAVLLLASPSHRWQPERVTTAPYGNDFLQEWIGGHLILTGEAKNLYDSKIFESRQHDPEHIGFQWSTASYFPPVYPPPHYWLATILAWIPYRFAAIVWLVLLAIAMSLGAWISAKHVVRFQEIQADSIVKNILEKWSWIAIVLFPSSVFCFVMEQKGPFWLLIFAATWGLLRQNRDGWAGVVFGLLSIKPTLFFLLPLVMIRYGRWRFVAGVAFSVLVVWGSAFVALPIEVWSGFAEKLRMSGTYAGIQGYHLDWSCNLMSIAYVAKAPTDVALLKWLLVIPLSLYGLWIVAGPTRLKIDHPSSSWNTLVVTFLLSPHAYYYDLVVMLMPILWYVAIDPKRGIFYYISLATAVVVAPFVLANLGIPLIPVVLAGLMVEQRLNCGNFLKIKNWRELDERVALECTHPLNVG